MDNETLTPQGEVHASRQATIRDFPEPNGGRVETGPVRFGYDWPGLFIRGDNAAHYAFLLRLVLKEPSTLSKSPLTELGLTSLLVDLESCLLKAPEASSVSSRENSSGVSVSRTISA